MHTQNREISWLRFNERVLDEAYDQNVPLLERLKFIAIFTSNLDEFFMVRVGSLFDLVSINDDSIDERSMLRPSEQLEKIYEYVRPLYTKKSKIYTKIKNELKTHNINSLNYDELTKKEEKFIKEYYNQQIKPILSPQIIDSLHPLPHINNKQICVFTMLKRKDTHLLGIIQIPSTLPNYIILPSKEVRFIKLEKIIYELCDDLFKKSKVVEKNCVCITRNADIQPDQETFDESIDFKQVMKSLLNKRNRLCIVRLEINNKISDEFKQMLCNVFKLKENQIFITSCSLNMNYIYDLIDKHLIRYEDLKYSKFEPSISSNINHNTSIIKQIMHKDLLLHYPYESMDSVIMLIKEATTNKDVLSIKITIYRLAKRAKLIDYLCEAAENGKEVTIVMELRARFDEKNNIDWSEKLEEAGCIINYGFDLYKTHSKLCLITIKDKNELKYITHIGTGNFNEKTSKQYTDISLLTSHHGIAMDTINLFNNINLGILAEDYTHLLVSPLKLRNPIIGLINKEIAKGEKGKIILKMNSITDKVIIDMLVDAAKCGVKITLIIRGICCVLPNIKEVTENIRVVSIVGRFLEHSRIYSFGEKEEQVIYISSADFMSRNTKNRIEVATPIYDQKIKAELNEILELSLKDNVKARVMHNDGSYHKIKTKDVDFNAQTYFIDYYKNRKTIKEKQPNVFIRLLNRIK